MVKQKVQLLVRAMRERASPVRGWTITYSRALGSGAPDLAITTISFLKQPQRGEDTGCQ